MEILREYLDTMFTGLPETEETKKAKEELFQMMEDKYNELTGMGVPKNEAIGTVISEFGNVDELKESLGIKDPERELPENSDSRIEIISEAEAAEYENHKIKESIRMSFGVALLILSPVALVLFYHVLELKGFAICVMFFLIAAGVFFIMVACGSMKAYKRIAYGKNVDENGFNEYEEGKMKLTKTGKIINAIFWPTVICIYFLWSFIGDAWDISWILWPIAPLVSKILTEIFKIREDEIS